jgi:hypothetical protein
MPNLAMDLGFWGEADRRDDCHRLVRCGVTIGARHGTSDPDNSCPATKPQLTFDLDACGGFGSRRRVKPTEVSNAKS